MSKRWPAKDPDEVLDYAFNWTNRNITGDPIISSTATVPVGSVVVESHGLGTVTGAATGYGTVTRLSGGTASAVDNQVLLHAITESGQELEQTVFIKIKER